MKYDTTQHKLKVLWNKDDEIKGILADKELNEDRIDTELNTPINYQSKRIHVYETDWEEADLGIQGSGTYEYYKAYELEILDIPLIMLPYININFVYKYSWSNDILVPNTIDRHFKLVDTNIEDEWDLNTLRKVTFFGGFGLYNFHGSYYSDQPQVYCKMIMHLSNPRKITP